MKKPAQQRRKPVRRLYYSDNLPVLRKMESESVDLIYLDPPFNSSRAYNIIYPGDLGQVTAFEDTWYWTPQCDLHLQQMREGRDILVALVEAMGKVQMSAYLVNMAARLEEMRRILKPTGSIYLHCDPTAGHYLKIVMDAIFGVKNFRNEIVWCYSHGGKSKKHFGRKHDTIFFYTKGKDYVFNHRAVRIEMKSGRKSFGGRLETDESGRKYRLVYGSKNKRGKTRYYKYYLDEGKLPEDYWIDINSLQSKVAERLGYPTQKPLALLERIVSASSNPGDLVLDPFCGCGTAAAAAEKLKRNWVGIDITYSAVAAIQERFRRQKLDIWGRIEILGKPNTVEEVDRQLLDHSSALYARKEFEKFCVATVGGLPNDRMGADGGVDGRIPLTTGERAVCSVKSGRVDVKAVRELAGLLKGKDVAGVLLTRQPPTSAMVKFARQAGLHRPAKKDLLAVKPFPRLQILTLEEILGGRRPELPV